MMPTILNPYVLLAAILSLLGAFGGGYWKGYGAADQTAALARLEASVRARDAALAAREQEARNAARIAQEAARREQAAAAEADILHRRIDDYARELAERDSAPQPAGTDKPAPDGCKLGPRDVERLRALGATAGATAPRPSGGAVDLRPARSGS